MHRLNPAQKEVYEELEAVSPEAAKQYLFEEIQRLNQLVEELLKEKHEQNQVLEDPILPQCANGDDLSES